MAERRIKNCICGSAAFTMLDMSDRIDDLYVICNGCGREGKRSCDVDEAIENWNENIDLLKEC